MSLTEFAKQELEAAGLFDKDSDYGGMLGEAVLDLIETFSEQGHSGASAAMTASLFNKLSRFEPIRPLTGADDEWVKVSDGLFQNKHCSRVFKDTKRGETYDIEGYVFTDRAGCSYTCSLSHKPVTFPYTPTTRYVREHSPCYYWLKLRSFFGK